MASGKDTADVYLTTRLLMACGSALVAADLVNRAREFIAKAKASAAGTTTAAK
jgi:hypothetical protein